MNIRETKKSWIGEITNRCGDCLEQGGYVGRVLAFDKRLFPEAIDAERAYEMYGARGLTGMRGVRVIRKGTICE